MKNLSLFLILFQIFSNSSQNCFAAETIKKITFANILRDPEKYKKIIRAEKLIQNIPATQSKQHLIQAILQELKLLDLSEKDKEFFLKIYLQEKVEEANGNYVFFHARQWKWNYFADIYKQLWNLMKNDHIGDNFTFLRFGIPGRKSKLHNNDVLFMNSAIFGNLTDALSNTARYWLNNYDMELSDVSFLTNEYLFRIFNLEKLYKKYEWGFTQLQMLHSRANNRGEFLLISIEPKNLNQNVYPTDPGGNFFPVTDKMYKTLDTKQILDTMKNTPPLSYFKNIPHISYFDDIIWALILGKWDAAGNYIPNSFVTDPHSGLAIYSFYEADEKIMDEYFRLRDQLFAQIKKDLAAQSAIKAKL